MVHLCLTKGDSGHERSLGGFRSRQAPLGRRSMTSLSVQSDLISQHLGQHSRSQRLLLDQLDDRCPVIL